MIKKNIQAAILTNQKSDLMLIHDLKVVELTDYQIFIKILYTGICKSQLMEIDGLRGHDPWLPHCLGHEAVGIVEKLGDGVSKVSVGDTVVVGWIVGEGNASESPNLHSDKLGKVNAGQCTTFSSHTVVAENRVTKLPPKFPVRLAALLGCALPTGAGIILNEMKPKIDDNVLVVGMGGIGISALLTLDALSIKNILCLDVDERKLELARKLTSCKTINTFGMSKLEIKEQIKLVSNEVGEFNYSLDAAGRIDTIELAFEALGRQGKCIFASHPEFGQKISIDPFELISGKEIYGTWGGASRPEIIISQLTELFSERFEDLELLVTRYKGINKINEAITDLRENTIVRAIVEL